MSRILFFGDAGSIHLRKWVSHFKRAGYETYLATFSLSDASGCEHVFQLSRRNVKVEGGNLHYILSLGQMIRLIRKIRPAYINAHFSSSYGFLACLARSVAGVKAVLSVLCYGSDILSRRYSFLSDVLNKYTLSRADRIVVVSEQIAEIVDRWGIDRAKVLKIQYGVEISNNGIRSRKDIDVISMRGFTRNSRIPELLRALKPLCDTGARVVFILSRISEEQFNKLVQEYPGVSFWKNIADQKVQELLSRAKIYVSATCSDGASLSLLEALASGAYPIISNIPANRSWVVDSLNGRLFDDIGDIEGLIKLTLGLKESELANVRRLNWKLVRERGEYSTNMNIIEEFITRPVSQVDLE